MMTIVQKPSPINLSGNLPSFIMFSDDPFNFVIKKGNISLLSGSYTPGGDRKVTIDVKDVIEFSLSFQFRDILETYTQDTLIDTFYAYINDELICNFEVIKGGISNFGMTPQTFLQQHFLTWQPREKRVSYSSPEYLTYYAVTDCRIKLKAYMSTVDAIEMVISELQQGKVYTIPVMYAVVAGKLNAYPAYYDIWVESADGSVRYSYIQRFVYEQGKSEQEEYIIFENSLGGVDCFRAYGNTVFNADNTHNIAIIDDQLNEYRIDTEYKYTKNTGYLTKYEAEWLKDFFPSTGKYIFRNNILRKIVLTEDNVSSSEQESVNSYEFTYRYADDNIYLNLPVYQNSKKLISPMSLNVDNVEKSLGLEPRLAEFPMQKLSEGSLIPVQEPFSERWNATNAGAIANYIIEKINSLTDGRLLDNRFKGYYLTETSLKESYPNPLKGDSAWVGEPFPGVVYTVENGKWKTSGKAPDFGDINLEDYATKEDLAAQDSKLSELSSEFSTVTNFNNDGFLRPDGTISESQPGSFKHTGYLKVDINYPIIFRADTVNEYLNYINFYDADKKFISGLSNTETSRSINKIEPDSIPQDTRYMIVCDKTKNVDSFVSYHPFMEQNVHRFVDTPKSKNIYCPLYSCYNLNSLDDTNRYDMPVFIVRNREYDTLTISKRDYGYFLEIYFYDIDNALVGSVKNKKEGTIDIPSTCEYIGFTDYGKELKDGGKSMVNWGSEVMEYVPYDSFFMQAFINKEYLNTYTKKAGVQFPFKEKGFVNVSGTINTTQTPEKFRFTDYIKIESNSYIMYLGNSSNEYVNVISFYDSDKNYISGISNIDTVGNEILHIISPEDIPEGTRYIICTARATQVDNDSAYLLCTPFRDNDNSVRIIDKPAGKNIYNQNYGDVSDLNYREIVKGPVFIERDRKYDTLTISKRASNYYLIVIFLDADFCEISKISDKREGDTLNIPSTCSYIQFKDYVGEINAGKSMVNWGSEILEYEPYKSVTANYTDINFFKNRYYHKESDFLATGSLVIDNVPNVKYNQTISLNARVETVGKITLSHGKTTYAAGMIDIDDTNIYTYTLVPESSETIPHGLTFNKFIECIIRQNDEATATVIIRTLGGEFKRENIPFLGCRDDVMLEAEGSNLSDIKLSYTCADFGKEIWSFGDSYFEKIPDKLKELGYNNSLFDAFSGRNSIQALSSLKKMIGIVGIPKLIYWPMGMNDPDTEESANSNWEKALNELINICRYYNIELVLATIPNIPSRNHEKKNDIVRNSGYRYADINKAVGADIDPNWYDGLISSDKVHPSLNAGDYVIAMEVINAIPELRI